MRGLTLAEKDAQVVRRHLDCRRQVQPLFLGDPGNVIQVSDAPRAIRRAQRGIEGLIALCRVPAMKGVGSVKVQQAARAQG